jgi:hypothetical protein
VRRYGWEWDGLTLRFKKFFNLNNCLSNHLFSIFADVLNDICRRLDVAVLMNTSHHIEESLFKRGVVVGYETINRWCDKFGASLAKRVKVAGSQPGMAWHLKGGQATQRTLLETFSHLESLYFDIKISITNLNNKKYHAFMSF